MANRVDLTNNKGSFDVTIPQEGKFRLSVKAYDDKDQLVDNGFLIHQSRTSTQDATINNYSDPVIPNELRKVLQAEPFKLLDVETQDENIAVLCNNYNNSNFTAWGKYNHKLNINTKDQMYNNINVDSNGITLTIKLNPVKRKDGKPIQQSNNTLDMFEPATLNYVLCYELYTSSYYRRLIKMNVVNNEIKLNLKNTLFDLPIIIGMEQANFLKDYYDKLVKSISQELRYCYDKLIRNGTNLSLYINNPYIYKANNVAYNFYPITREMAETLDDEYLIVSENDTFPNIFNIKYTLNDLIPIIYSDDKIGSYNQYNNYSLSCNLI